MRDELPGEDSIKDIVEARPPFDYWARVANEGLGRVASGLAGPFPPAGFLTDGCTHCPDFGPGGEALWLACGWHDWCYDVHCEAIPNTDEGRREGDEYLWRNLKYLGLDEFLADDFWAAVRVGAASHFKKVG